MERRKPKTLKPKRNALCRLRGERLARVEGCVRKPPPHAHRVPILAEGVRLSPSRATTKHAFHAASRARVEVCRKVPTHELDADGAFAYGGGDALDASGAG